MDNNELRDKIIQGVQRIQENDGLERILDFVMEQVELININLRSGDEVLYNGVSYVCTSKTHYQMDTRRYHVYIVHRETREKLFPMVIELEQTGKC